MRLVFDLSSLPYSTGVSLYSTSLYQALRRLNPPFQLHAFATSLRQQTSIRDYIRQTQTPATVLPLPPSLTGFLFNNLNLPLEVLTGPCDLFHTWDWYYPRSLKTKIISTVHDLALFRFPQTAHPQIKHHHQQSLARAKLDGGQLIAVSQATKNDLVDLFDIAPDKIHVIYEALPESSKVVTSPKQLNQVKLKYKLNKPYFLIVGTQEPRKNIPAMIKAWQAYSKDYDLVLVGRTGWDSLKSQSGMHLLGHLPSSELAAIYRQAQLLLYASLYEGFGLPILEAFYHQIPVVTSNVSSLPEVAGKAAILVNPHEVEAISQGITQALNQKSQLIVKGLTQLKHFSWDKAAQETLKVYQLALNQ